MNYILKDGVPVHEPDIKKWGLWFQTADRVLNKTKVEGVEVSTVFLGLDHGFDNEDLPVLWETMIFGGPHDQEEWRYTSREEAMAGHERIVRALLEGREP